MQDLFKTVNPSYRLWKIFDTHYQLQLYFQFCEMVKYAQLAFYNDA